MDTALFCSKINVLVASPKEWLSGVMLQKRLWIPLLLIVEVAYAFTDCFLTFADMLQNTFATCH